MNVERAAHAGENSPPRARRRWFGARRAARATDAEPIELNHWRVYIFASMHGLTFAVALLLMLSGSINYALGLGFVLTFALIGMSIAGLFHTFRNFVNLRVTTVRTTPVFAGDKAAFVLRCEDRSGRRRFGIRALRGPVSAVADVPVLDSAPIELLVPAEKRGWLALGRITLESRYPLGLFRAWSYVHPAARVLVYPRPDIAPLPAEQFVAEAGDAIEQGAGDDDFAGLRGYRRGDSSRHIAWKTVARTDELVTKQFSQYRAAELVIDWNALPAHMPTEARLARLCGWVLQAEAAHRLYSLRIPGHAIEAGGGHEHRERCLKTLALFELGPDTESHVARRP